MRIKKHIIVLVIFVSQLSWAQIARIPFEFFKEKYVLIHLTANNSKEPLCFYFDTGATTTVLDSTMAKKIGIEPNYTHKAAGAGGEKNDLTSE